MILVPVLSGWLLVAAACALIIGRGIRTAELRERGRVEGLARPAAAEAQGYVQPCLFDSAESRDESDVDERLVAAVG